ncbi:MAG TPA: PPK2 family polyphosphate kinase, partial [Methylomirabilota bacterium]|nr:PPK2 family polyphosphate kinase [Methylomirabilota bacterium]
MKERSIQKQSAKLAARYLVSSGEGFRLRDFDPADTAHFKSKQHAGELLESGIEQLRHLQEKLYAANSWSLLIILQAMDAGGKDGVISHVMSGVNPQGCEVHAFKVPSAEELSHDFLWRAHAHTPERGRIGIFNRSYYEDVLVVRVHPELLRSVRIPKKMLTNDIWVERYKDINAFERLLAQSGVVTLKFFLHLSKKEQRKRFLERLDDAKKHWKFSANDLKERAYWKAYQKAYEEM